MKKGISVLMSVYEKEVPQFLNEAIESVINQTLKPTEIVIVKDGPLTDELNKVINSWCIRVSGLFKIINLKENVGLGEALRIGVEECDCEIIARMDADDVCSLTRFEKQFKVIENEGIDIVGSYVAEFRNSINEINCIKKVPISSEEIYEYGKSRCPMNHPSVMFKKEKVLSAGNYRTWHFNEDYDLWSRMILKDIKFKNLNESLVFMRVDKETFSRRGGKKYFKSELDLQKEFWKNGYISFFRLGKNIFLRFIIQILLPNSLRGILYKKILRSANEGV